VVAHYVDAELRLGKGKEMTGQLVVDGFNVQSKVAVTLFDDR